jgi:hypothetical protein
MSTFYGTVIPSPNGWFNVMYPPYNATGNGSTDDTAAIQAAINACIAAGGGVVYLPEGNYLLSSSLTVNSASPGPSATVSLSFLGAGAQSTTLVMSSASQNVISGVPYPTGSDLNGCRFSDFGVRFSTTPTAGSVFYLPWCGNSVFERVIVTNCFNFVTIGGTSGVSTVNELWFEHITCSQVIGTALNFSGQGGNIWVRDSYFSGNGNTSTSSCLQWNNSYFDVIWLRGLDFEGFGSGMSFSASSTASPNAGLTDAFIEDIIIDAPGSYGITLAAAGAYAIHSRIKFRNLWVTTSGASTPCISVGATSGATVEDITFIGCNFSGTQVALSVAGNGTSSSVVTDIAAYNCQFYESPIGIAVNGCANLTLQNCSVGSPYSGGSGVGIEILGSADTTGALVEGNRVDNYTTPYSFALGSGSRVSGNLGINPVGALTAPTYTSGTATPNTFPYEVRVNVSGSTAISINGAPTGLATGSFVLGPGETITPTGSGGAWTWSGL